MKILNCILADSFYGNWTTGSLLKSNVLLSSRAQERSYDQPAGIIPIAVTQSAANWPELIGLSMIEITGFFKG